MMDCMLPIGNIFLFYYIYIVFDLSLMLSGPYFSKGA